MKKIEKEEKNNGLKYMKNLLRIKIKWMMILLPNLK
jgi:hypothetical protein